MTWLEEIGKIYKDSPVGGAAKFHPTYFCLQSTSAGYEKASESAQKLQLCGAFYPDVLVRC